MVFLWRCGDNRTSVPMSAVAATAEDRPDYCDLPELTEGFFAKIRIGSKLPRLAMLNRRDPQLSSHARYGAIPRPGPAQRARAPAPACPAGPSVGDRKNRRRCLRSEMVRAIARPPGRRKPAHRDYPARWY